jgi:hypothetical protein
VEPGKKSIKDDNDFFGFFVSTGIFFLERTLLTIVILLFTR